MILIVATRFRALTNAWLGNVATVSLTVTQGQDATFTVVATGDALTGTVAVPIAM